MSPLAAAARSARRYFCALSGLCSATSACPTTTAARCASESGGASTEAAATSMPSDNSLSHLRTGPIEVEAVAFATGTVCPRSQLATVRPELSAEPNAADCAALSKTGGRQRKPDQAAQWACRKTDARDASDFPTSAGAAHWPDTNVRRRNSASKSPLSLHHKRRGQWLVQVYCGCWEYPSPFCCSCGSWAGSTSAQQLEALLFNSLHVMQREVVLLRSVAAVLVLAAVSACSVSTATRVQPRPVAVVAEAPSPVYVAPTPATVVYAQPVPARTVYYR